LSAFRHGFNIRVIGRPALCSVDGARIRSHLLLLNVIRQFKKEEALGELSTADVIYHLNQLIPGDASLESRPEILVKYGEPAKSIIETASHCSADLIVLGVRSGDTMGVATHVAVTSAHEIVVNVSCPGLTVSG
jgi:hypothetical protein